MYMTFQYNNSELSYHLTGQGYAGVSPGYSKHHPEYFIYSNIKENYRTRRNQLYV